MVDTIAVLPKQMIFDSTLIESEVCQWTRVRKTVGDKIKLPEAYVLMKM